MSERTRKARAEKAAKHPIHPFNPRMNRVREKLLKQMEIAIIAHQQREDVGDFRHYHQAIDFNTEFMERGRGKGGGARKYIKSVANQKLGNSKYDPHQGAQEMARRV
jgi:hypothetical protein